MSEQDLNIETTASRLAREIARNLIPLNEIKERYLIDEDAYQRVVGSAFFKQRLEEELDLWAGSEPKAIEQRIQAKLLTMIEESIPEVFELLHDKKQPMAAKIDALKWAASGSGLIKRDSAGSTTGERVRFNIFIGDRQVNIDKPLIEAPTIDGTVLLDKKSA